MHIGENSCLKPSRDIKKGYILEASRHHDEACCPKVCRNGSDSVVWRLQWKEMNLDVWKPSVSRDEA